MTAAADRPDVAGQDDADAVEQVARAMGAVVGVTTDQQWISRHDLEALAAASPRTDGAATELIAEAVAAALADHGPNQCVSVAEANRVLAKERSIIASTFAAARAAAAPEEGR